VGKNEDKGRKERDKEWESNDEMREERRGWKEKTNEEEKEESLKRR